MGTCKIQMQHFIYKLVFFIYKGYLGGGLASLLGINLLCMFAWLNSVNGTLMPWTF